MLLCFQCNDKREWSMEWEVNVVCDRAQCRFFIPDYSHQYLQSTWLSKLGKLDMKLACGYDTVV